MFCSAQDLCSGRKNRLKLSFPAPFFGSFFGRAKNEQRNLGQAKEPSGQKVMTLKIKYIPRARRRQMNNKVLGEQKMNKRKYLFNLCPASSV
jgi:hypothetical protein